MYECSKSPQPQPPNGALPKESKSDLQQKKYDLKSLNAQMFLFCHRLELMSVESSFARFMGTEV